MKSPNGSAEQSGMNQWLEMGAAQSPTAVRLLAQVLGNTQRIMRIKYDFSKEKFSPRKTFPSNPKTLGDHLIVKRCVANLSQAEVAALIGISCKTLRAWEYDKRIPNRAELNQLAGVLPLDLAIIEIK